MAGELSRRVLLRRGAAAALVCGTGTLVAACSRSLGGKATNGSASTGKQNGKTVLGMRCWGVGSGSALIDSEAASINSLLYNATAPWRAQNPGVDIQILDNTGGTAAVTSSILAGKGPDIYHSWHPGTMFTQAGFAADLRPYLSKYNANLSAFNKAQADLYQLPDGSIRGLPYYLGTMTLAVCKTMFNARGIQYPAAGWTHTDYAAIATQLAATGSASKPVYGGDFGISDIGAPTSYLPPACILEGFGGSYVNPQNRAQCNLASAGSIQAVQWAYQLAQSHAVTGPSTTSTFGVNLGMYWAPSWALTGITQWSAFDWDFYDMPIFPSGGGVTTATEDFWALNPESKHLDLAWDLLYWCSFQPSWQISQMRIFLLSPALTSLWDQWATYVPQLAPPLATKNIRAFVSAAQGGVAYPQPFFQYQDPQAEQLINTAASGIWSGKAGVTAALTQAQTQVDALELSLQSSSSSKVA